MTQSQNCNVLLLLVLTLVVATIKTDAFIVMTGHAARLTKPPLPQSTSMNSAARRSSLPLRYRNRDDEAETQVSINSKQELSSPTPSGGLGIPVVGAIAISQVMTFSVASLLVVGALFVTGNPVELNAIHWNWGNEFYPLFDFTLTPWRLVEGVLAAVPMIYVGTVVENSDHRDSSHVNFSTMNMVMTLFGRRRNLWGDENEKSVQQNHPEIPDTFMPHVLVLVAAISLLTGFAEEIVFRGEIPFLIALFSHSPVLALFGQSVLFGVGHLSRRATAGENRIVSGIQSLNGLWYGLVYLLAGGDVLPCIIAHTLYDSHVFMETWMRINDQMDYTDEKAMQSLSKGELIEIDVIRKEAQFMTDEVLDFTRQFFYAFDYEHKGSLSRSDLQRAVSYAFLQDPVQPTQARVSKLFDKVIQRRRRNKSTTSNEEERLNLAEFLRVLFVLKGNPEGTRAKPPKALSESMSN